MSFIMECVYAKNHYTKKFLEHLHHWMLCLGHVFNGMRVCKSVWGWRGMMHAHV